jgi:hypothetical protein
VTTGRVSLQLPGVQLRSLPGLCHQRQRNCGQRGRLQQADPVPQRLGQLPEHRPRPDAVLVTGTSASALDDTTFCSDVSVIAVRGFAAGRHSLLATWTTARVSTWIGRRSCYRYVS